MTKVFLFGPLVAVCHGVQEHALAGVDATSRSGSLLGFQKFAASLVEKYEKAGVIDDQETRDVIGQVKDWIKGLYPEMKAEHETDANSIAACGAGSYSTQCQPKEDSLDAILNLGRNRQGKKTEFHRCVEDAAGQAYDIDKSCEQYDAFRMTPEAAFPVCVGEGHLSEPYITTKKRKQRETMESCLEDVKDWMDQIWPLYKACNCKAYGVGKDEDLEKQCCHRSAEGCATSGEKETCVDEQNTYDAAVCEHELKKSTVCADCHRCWQNHANRCDICGDIQIAVAARKADYESGERIICLLNVLLDSEDKDKPTDLETCKNTVYDTSEFDLECDVEPPIEDCKANCETPVSARDVPCTAAFIEHINEMEISSKSASDFSAQPLSQFDIARVGQTGLWDSCHCERCIAWKDSKDFDIEEHLNSAQCTMMVVG